MIYLKKISSLEEMASAQVAINLCQENSFKEVVLCLEKPTYGAFIHGYACSIFVSDPEKLSRWAEVKDDVRSLEAFKRLCYKNDKEKVLRWDAAIDEQCQRLTEGLPHLLKQGVDVWISRISLEYFSYSRRQEVLYGVSRYLLMDLLTREDWTETGRLDEAKIAKRMLKDERLTILEKYRIACAYCLHVNIPQLWESLTQEEKQLFNMKNKHCLIQEGHHLVLVWSYQMKGLWHKWEKKILQKIPLWTYMAQQATNYGNRAALMSCWKRLDEKARQEIVMDMALQSLQTWQSILDGFGQCNYWKEKLLSNELPIFSPNMDSVVNIQDLNLPSYFSELMCFFLSQMNEEQQLTFFKQAFEENCCNSVLECFLDWPHQHDFLPTINRLWGITPKEKYGQCLLTLVGKYIGDDEKENCYYDYQSLLWTLWEETPEEYKQYLFLDKYPHGSHFPMVVSEGKELLFRLLERSPIQKKDEVLFKRVFHDLPPEERKRMIQSKVGENICLILTQEERWSFVNWLLEECLPTEEIPMFKRQFIQSNCGLDLCLSKYEEKWELWEDLIDWPKGLDITKAQCMTFLGKGEFSEVEHTIRFAKEVELLVSTEDSFRKDAGNKRAFVVIDESGSTRKKSK